MSERRVLVLGGGSSQIRLLERCRERGLFTVLADRDPDAPGRPLASAFEPASTFDADAVLAAARRQRVDAVMTAGTDQPVLTAARVAAALGLPSPIDVDTALAVTNKRVMKTRLAGLGVPVAPSVLVASAFEARELAALRPPFVTKPVDSQGQRGVYRVEDAAGVRAVADEVLSWSREERFLVEEYVPGAEVTMSGWVADGRLRILSVTDRVTIEAPPSIGVCVAHRFPSNLAGRVPEVEELTRRIVRGLAIASGPVYFQFLLGDGPAVVNEIACRLGGAYEDRFLPRLTGVDIVDLLIDASLGQPALPEPDAAFDAARAPRFVSVPLLFCRPGRIAALSDLEVVRRLPGVAAFEWLQRPGTVIRPMVNSTQRVAYAIIEAGNRDAINTRVDAFFEALAVRADLGEPLLMDTRDLTRHPPSRP
jgi:biotin carboxylase